MDLASLVKLFADTLDIAVLLTDADLEWPGPTVLYANPAVARLSGYSVEEVVGNSPRLFQGPGTNSEATRHLPRRLRVEGRFLGVLQNYRKGGDPYLCEIDVRPILGRDSKAQAFIAFEREVVRRRGKPSRSGTRRYRATAVVAPPLLAGDVPLFD